MRCHEPSTFVHEADGDGGSRCGAGPDDCGAGCCTPLRGLRRRRAGGDTAAAAASNKTITYFVVRRPLATARVAITGAGTDVLCRLALGGSPGSKL